MTIDYSVRVDIGVKESNDDRVLVGGKIYDSGLDHGSGEMPFVAVVCDGCGGYAGGEMAAEAVLETIRQETGRTSGETEPAETGRTSGETKASQDFLREALRDEDFLPQVLEKCKAAVFEKKKIDFRYSSMCTTVAGCIFDEEQTIIFHAGDSRVYRFDGQILAKMTVDHSRVQMMVDMGKMTEEEALVSPERNIINRCIGIDCPPPNIYVAHSPILPGEKFLLCSDGLWEYVSKENLIEVLSSDRTLEEMADTLVQQALDNGSTDNVCVCICGRERMPGAGNDEEDDDLLD